MRNLLPRVAACLALTSVLAPIAAQPETVERASKSKPMGWTGVLDEDAFAALHDLKKDQAPKLSGETIEVGGAKAYLSLPKGGKATAAVLVIHEWWGLNDHIKHWADRLAADGYAALAIDLYGGAVATTREEALAAMQAVDEDKALATLQAAHAFLASDPRVSAAKRACIGWCFGGGWSLKLAMAAPDLDAAVVYYGRLVDDPEQLAGIRAPILGVFGNQDTGIPPKAVDGFEGAMKTAGKDIRILRYDANHAFANPSSARYDKEHAAAAWKEVRGFLREHLAAPAATGTFAAGPRTVTYSIPSGWTAAALRPMREVNLQAPAGVECYVTVLGGTGGGVDSNLNRWRQQMGQAALAAEDIAKLPRLSMLGTDAPLLVVDGTYSGMGGQTTEDARMMATICPLEGVTVFVKMLGPEAAVAAQDAAFRAFCASMK